MDPELAEARARRMAQIKEQQQESGTRQAEMEERQREQDDQRRVLLRTILTPEAHQRLDRIGLVKPEKAKQLENLIIQNARLRRLPTPLSEQNLIGLLENVKEKAPPKVSIQRRRDFDDDD